MKSITRFIPILLLVACTASFPVEAQKKPSASKPGPTNPTPTQDIKSPSKGPIGKTIGTCDTVKGCKTLKAACESKEVGGTFKLSHDDGSGGICVKKGAQSQDNFVAPSSDTHAAKCFTHALCRTLKRECNKQKGTWDQKYPNTGHGTCID